MNKYKKSGWYNESHRHSLASKGIKTGRKKVNYAYSTSDLPNIATQGIGVAGATAVEWIPVGVSLLGAGYAVKKGKKIMKDIDFATNIEIGQLFKGGATSGKSNSMQIIDSKDKTLLVGYGHAVYGSRDKNTGEITFYKGWDGYSITTSKQLSQTGLRSADKISDKKPSLSDIDYSLQHYKEKSIFEKEKERRDNLIRQGHLSFYEGITSGDRLYHKLYSMNKKQLEYQLQLANKPRDVVFIAKIIEDKYGKKRSFWKEMLDPEI